MTTFRTGHCKRFLCTCLTGGCKLSENTRGFRWAQLVKLIKNVLDFTDLWIELSK